MEHVYISPKWMGHSWVMWNSQLLCVCSFYCPQQTAAISFFKRCWQLLQLYLLCNMFTIFSRFLVYCIDSLLGNLRKTVEDGDAGKQ